MWVMHIVFFCFVSVQRNLADVHNVWDSVRASSVRTCNQTNEWTVLVLWEAATHHLTLLLAGPFSHSLPPSRHKHYDYYSKTVKSTFILFLFLVCIIVVIVVLFLSIISTIAPTNDACVLFSGDGPAARNSSVVFARGSSIRISSNFLFWFIDERGKSKSEREINDTNNQLNVYLYRDIDHFWFHSEST